MILVSGFYNRVQCCCVQKHFYRWCVCKVTRAPPRGWHPRRLPGVGSDSIFHTLFPQDGLDLVDLLEWYRQ